MPNKQVQNTQQANGNQSIWIIAGASTGLQADGQSARGKLINSAFSYMEGESVIDA